MTHNELIGSNYTDQLRCLTLGYKENMSLASKF